MALGADIANHLNSRHHTKVPMFFDQLPDSAFLRESQLLQNSKHPERPGIIPFSGPTLWRRVNDGSFPRPHKLSPRVTAWQVGDIRNWLAAQTQGAKSE